MKSRVVAIAAVSLLLALPPAAVASETDPYVAGDNESVYSDVEGNEPEGLAMVADFLIARPLGLVATIVGGVVYVAALPFELMSRDVENPARKLIAEPAAYTFRRPLGEFDWR